jgi:outer membrane protein assembly factor BamB
MGPSTSADYFIGQNAYSAASGLLYSDVAASTAPSLFSPGLIAINPGCGHPSVAWRAAFGSSADAPRSVPATSAGGVVFAGSGGAVWALDASTGTILGGGPFLHTGGAVRMPATIDNNWVFIIDNSGDLYGLTTDSRVATIQAKNRPLTAQQRAVWTEKSRD